MSDTGKTAEQIAAEAADAARVSAEAETARVAAEAETARLAAEAAKAKTPEELAAEETARVAAEAAKNKAKEPSWEEKRLAKVTADKAALAARLAQYETPDGKPKAPPTGGDNPDLLPRAEVERLALEQAEAIAQRNTFNAQCNSAAQEGRKLFPDFDTSVAELTKLVDKSDLASRQRYDDFLAAALETGEAHKVIYQLGKNLEEADRVMGLSPVKRAQELATLAASDAKQVSDLPKPLTPVGGRSSGPGEIAPDNPTAADKLSSAEWHKRRQAQIDANAKPFERRARG